MLTAGIIAALGMIFLLLKFNIRKILNHDILIDVLITFFFIFIFAGTFSGMIAGLFAGLIISVFLFIAKRTLGYQKLRFVKTDKFPYRQLLWVHVIPRRNRTNREEV